MTYDYGNGENTGYIVIFMRNGKKEELGCGEGLELSYQGNSNNLHYIKGSGFTPSTELVLPHIALIL